MENRKLLEPISTLLALGLLIGGCVMILLPFSSALVWAAIFVFSTRHLYWRVNDALGGRNWLSASIFVTLILGLIVLPLLYAIVSFGGIASDFVLRIIDQLQGGIPSLPTWIANIHWVGPTIQEWWDKLVLGDDRHEKPAEIWRHYRPGAGHAVIELLYCPVFLRRPASVDPLAANRHEAGIR